MGLFGKKRVDPNTGEVRRTGLRKLAHGFHGLEHGLRPVLKPALPAVGSIVGGMFGGPMGAIVGGSVGGALSSKRHPLDHALGGAAFGMGNAMVAPMLGNAFGVNPGSLAGKAMMMESPSLLSQMGIPGIRPGTNTGGIGFSQLLQNSHSQPEYTPGNNIPEHAPQRGFTMDQLMKAGLFGVSVAGMLGAKSKVPHQPSVQEIMAQNRPQWGAQHQAKKVKPLERKYKAPPVGYRPGIDPEWAYFEEANPEVEYYAHGGEVGHEYIDGDYGGQDDNIYKKLPNRSYVMDATTISLLGDGNSKNGAKRIKKFLNQLDVSSGIVSGFNSGPTKGVDAKVSSGELFLEPEEVIKIGKGNYKRGVKKLDNMRENIRKHKGVKKFLPPKSKPITSYMR